MMSHVFENNFLQVSNKSAWISKSLRLMQSSWIPPVWEMCSQTPVWTFLPGVAMTHQYLSSSSSFRKVIVTVKTPASLSSSMKLLSLNRFLGVFTTMVHRSYLLPLHQYFVFSLNTELYWQVTFTDPPYAPATILGADSRSEPTACLLSQSKQRTGAAKWKHTYIYYRSVQWNHTSI